MVVIHGQQCPWLCTILSILDAVTQAEWEGRPGGASDRWIPNIAAGAAKRWGRAWTATAAQSTGMSGAAGPARLGLPRHGMHTSNDTRPADLYTLALRLSLA